MWNAFKMILEFLLLLTTSSVLDCGLQVQAAQWSVLFDAPSFWTKGMTEGQIAPDARHPCERR